MKASAALLVDLETTPLGTRSRLADELAGESVLRRTVQRIGRADSISSTTLLCPKAQHEACAALVGDLPVEVMSFDDSPPAWAQLVRVGRKWALDGWRGGIGSTTCFDEYFHGPALSGLLKRRQADALLIVPPAAPLLNPDLADRMIDHRRTRPDSVRMVFTQAPPGVAGVLLDASLVHELAEKKIPIGWAFSFKPDAPEKDLIFDECCLEIPTPLRHATGRLIVDTDRAQQRVADYIEYMGNPEPRASARADPHDDEGSPNRIPSSFPELETKTDLDTLGEWLIRRDDTRVEATPREVEIELTTHDPYPRALLRPRGSLVKQRAPIDPALVRKIAESLTCCDDSLVVLGGFGEPLRHPRFDAVLEALRPRGGCGVYGLTVRTAGVDLDERIVELLVAHRVDVLNVVLDAWSDAKYGALNAPDDPSSARLDRVLPWFEKIESRARSQGVVTPIIIPEMTKAKQNLDELEAFHDGWIRKQGTVCLRGYTHRAAQLPDHSVINMAPAARTPCRRIQTRCTVLADAAVIACEEDFNGLHPVGHIAEQSLEQIWQSPAFHNLRKSHRAGQFDPTPLCAACNEWHRP